MGISPLDICPFCPVNAGGAAPLAGQAFGGAVTRFWIQMSFRY
jgi:hypothetical protein